MFFEVPQYIDIEDKIAFQLTSKQLGWFALGGMLIFLAWGIFDKTTFIVASIFIALLSSVMSFIRPYGLSMASFISYGVFYFLRPKTYIWQKNFFQIVEKEDKQGSKDRADARQKKAQTILDKKNLKVDKIAELLDNVQKF